ncbi:hypothetical protein [Hydromonas duriensis]|uniref:Uncharacterized protein n=1 Tax=Hydromonas duriensis TaxID=1527608 RepID=A0A4R6Y420_9BURK|nr:hypothetical protein [Hydromonas duriensis]TDR27735.1 hypothetical protein DFR44_1429 [Hydromonas duriensis]
MKVAYGFRKKMFLISLFLGMLAIPLALLGLFVVTILGDSNHSGLDFVMCSMVLLVFSAVSWAVFYTTKQKAFLFVGFINLFCVVLFVFSDSQNIMVEYNKWVERGMPEMFEPSREAIRIN